MPSTTGLPLTNGTGHPAKASFSAHNAKHEERPRRVIGFHEAHALAGQHMVDNCERLESMNPSLGRHVLENGFGGSTTTSTMDHRQWALHTLGFLTAMGDCSDQLQVYLGAAIKHGATEAEILDVISHAASFGGAPRAVNTMRRCHDVLLSNCKFPSVTIKESIARLHDHETLVRDTGGSGIPIVLIHALSLDGRMFNDLIPLLSTQTGARVITYDLRNHGHARGAPLTQSLEHSASDLLELLNLLHLDTVDVIGASYGGAIAQYFTLLHPDRVRSVCPMATGAQGNQVLYERATRAENGEMPQLRTEALVRWFSSEALANNIWGVRYARAILDRVRVEEWSAAWRSMSRLDTLGRIKDITCPILVLCGTKDLSATPERMKPIHEEAVKAGRNSEYVELAKGTHMMAMEIPREVAEALTRFRRKVDEGLME